MLKATYEDLEKRARKYNRYARPIEWLTGSWGWVAIVGVILFELFVIFDMPLLILYIITALFSYYIIGKIAIFFLRRKANVYRLSPQELATFYSCSIMLSVDSLSAPATSKNPELKKECQKLLEKQTRALLSVLESDWTIGDFRVGEKTFGTLLSMLKQGFRDKVIPNVEHGDPKDLKKIQTVILSLVYANSVENLEHVNESISKLEPRELREKGYWNSLMNGKAAKYLRKNEVAQYLLFGTAMFFVSVLVYFVALDLVQLSRDVSFYSAIGFLGVLIMAFATLISTRTKRKEKVQ